jgi:ParD-like antitoxin of type II bacterial toxin-antitoxin system
MPQAVRISDQEMERLREAASTHSRSISGQAEHWLKLGRLFEHDPALNLSRIERALRGELSPDALTGPQQELYFDRFEQELWQDSAALRQAFKDLVAEQGGVGYLSDDSDEIVTRKPAAG